MNDRVFLRDAAEFELRWIGELEQATGEGLILPYTPDKHWAEFAKKSVRYKIVMSGARLMGFVILALDADGRSLEFRRIVIAQPGRGVGKEVVRLIDDVCVSEFKRSLIWLDVFSDNMRARHVYSACGYHEFARARHNGRTLLLYQKTLGSESGAENNGLS